MEAAQPPHELAERLGRLLGLRPDGFEPVAGGYTHAGRWRAHLPDGRTAFAKVATDPDTSVWLRTEAAVYEAWAGAPFLADVLAWDDDGGEALPMLVLEDLGTAHWPPPWRLGDLDAVLETLAAVAAMPPPVCADDAAPWRGRLDGWPDVAEDPAPFLSLDVASAAWLNRCLPTLAAASAAADLSGTESLHFDLRSDNMCRRPSGQVVLVDWNFIAVGSATFDLAAFAPSVEEEGGPPPETLLGPGHGDHASLIAGYFASHAGRPIIERAPRVREIQRRQLTTALPWACRALDLPPPGAGA